jgi:hypothetical protein
VKFPSLFLPVSLALAGALLGACEPIQIEVILTEKNTGGTPPSTEPTPDAGQPDAGVPPEETGSCEGGWRTSELAADVDSLDFTFDSEAVGHFVFSSSDQQIYTGSTRTGRTVVAAEGLKGFVRGFAVDATGWRHLLYSDASSTEGSSTTYAHDRWGAWQRTVVARDSHPVALKLDASEFAHALLLQGTGSARTLAYATNRSGQWVVTDLGIKSRNGLAALALDSKGNAHIAWHDNSDSGIYYATNSSGTWFSEMVEDAQGNEPVLAIDLQGRPHVLFSHGGSSATHVTKQAGSWRSTTVAGANGIAMDLRVDSAGNLHALMDRSQNPKIVYATRKANGSTWSVTPIISLDGQGGVSYLWRNVLGLDAAGKVHVGYWYIVTTDGAGIAGDYVRYAQPCP